MDEDNQPVMPAGWVAGAARVCALVERTEALPAALFVADRP